MQQERETLHGVFERFRSDSITATPTIKGLSTNQMRLIYQINQLDAC
jgi:hypothetical protein